MKREQVYVLVDTPEKCKRAYDILSSRGERMTPLTEWSLYEGYLMRPCNILSANERDEFWFIGMESDKTEISLDELEEMLRGGKVVHSDSKDGKFVKELVEIFDGDYFNFEEQASAIIAKVKEYSDIQTSELRKQLEDIKLKSAELIREATSVYCHYNELIKSQQNFMDFQTLKELQDLISLTPNNHE